MPFIRGRYYINPIMGEALEAAREAEAALHALEHGARDGHDGANHANDQADGFASPHPGDHATTQAPSGPVHRIEIEASEMVPAHSGRAERGFVARVHRHPPSAAPHDAADSFASQGTSHGSATVRPETHVFSDHRDLVNFLRDELASSALFSK